MFFFRSSSALLVAGLLLAPALYAARAQDTAHRGRKYKAPPATSHIEVDVLKGSTGKPILNAAVVFHAVKDGRDEGNLEVKTNEEGKAVIDVIATGSAVDVQVIADGLSTYAQQYQVDGPTKTIEIRMQSPRAQISAYVDNSGKASNRPLGVQEPSMPSTPPVIQPPQPTNHTSDPNPQAPVDPNATPGNTQNKTPPRGV